MGYLEMLLEAFEETVSLYFSVGMDGSLREWNSHSRY